MEGPSGGEQQSSKEKPVGIWRITPEQYESLKDGTKLTSIEGKVVCKGVDEIPDLDELRGGYIAYGFPVGSEAPKDVTIDKKSFHAIHELGSWADELK